MRGVEEVWNRLTKNTLHTELSLESLQRGLQELGVTSTSHTYSHPHISHTLTGGTIGS